MLSAVMDEVRDKHKKQHNEVSKFSHLYTMSQWKSSLRTKFLCRVFLQMLAPLLLTLCGIFSWEFVELQWGTEL